MLTDAEKLKEFRESLNLSQTEFAQKLNKGISTIGMIEAGKRSLSWGLKNTIKEVFNYDIDKQVYIIEKEFTVNTSNIIPIPYYHIKAACNPHGESLIDYPEQESLYADKRFLQNILGINPYNCSIIEAKGDSMDSGLNNPDDIKDGDLLLIDNSSVNFINNKTFLIQLVASNELLIKKVDTNLNGDVILYSNNISYPPRKLTEADNALIIGRIVYNWSKESF